MRVTLLLLALTGCAHTPDPPGEACEPCRAGWIEYRAATCAYWRCEAATLRWTLINKEDGPCL